jgi:hypothetical protein
LELIHNRFSKRELLMFRRAALAAALSAAAALAAHAEPPRPTVDFRGDWVLSDGKGMQITADMYYSADSQKMRIDMDQQGMSMSSVRDMESGETIMWSSQMPGMGMRMPTVKDTDFDGEPTADTKTIGNEICTIWKVKTVQVCLTEENIPLEATGEGFSASLENLERGAQDSTLFEVPAGLNIMDMPATMPGGLKPGSGLPF